jgi:anaerobic magnesium-protoporphyrin IX monomethyl ester cyclase
MSAQLDLLLVNAGGTRKRVYQNLSTDFAGLEPPSWALLTAGYIRKYGFQVDILDANLENLTAQETAQEIVKRNPAFVGIPVYGQQANTSTPTMIGVSELCKAIKALDPHRTIVLSGWHPSALPERTMKEEVCDYVSQGEGFYTYLGLLQGQPKKDISGLWWREGSEIVHNTRPRNIENLTEELSEVAWDLVPIGKYRSFNWIALRDMESRNRYASMFTSLGCPFRCNFCAIHATFGEHRLRYWNPQWILKQIDILVQKYNVKNLKINDELFVFNPKHYMPIVDGLIERNYGLNIAAFARVDAVREEHLPKLKQAGFNWFELGIETGNADVLKRASKGKYTVNDIKNIVGKIHDAGIDLCANFMFGLPGDNEQTMQETLNLCFELMPAFPSFFCAMAAPGSDLYDEAVKKDGSLPKSWTGYAQQGYDFEPMPTEYLTTAQVVRFRDQAFNAYFRSPSYYSLIEHKFGPQARAHVEAMAKHDLKRRILGD